MSEKPITKKVFPELNKKLYILGIPPILFLVLVVVLFMINALGFMFIKSIFGYAITIGIDLLVLFFVRDAYISKKNRTYSILNQLTYPLKHPIVEDKDSILNAFIKDDHNRL